MEKGKKSFSLVRTAVREDERWIVNNHSTDGYRWERYVLTDLHFQK